MVRTKRADDVGVNSLDVRGWKFFCFERLRQQRERTGRTRDDVADALRLAVAEGDAIRGKAGSGALGRSNVFVNKAYVAALEDGAIEPTAGQLAALAGLYGCRIIDFYWNPKDGPEPESFEAGAPAMNLARNPTVGQLAAILRSCDDLQDNHVTWVDRAGNVFVEPQRQYIARNGGEPCAEEKFRVETAIAGNDYVGPRAASDADYIRSQFEYLKQLWDTGWTGFSDWDGDKGLVGRA